MNLYIDTSALVKLYVNERGSEDVETWIAQSDTICTSLVALPEARSALVRRLREGAITAVGHTLALDQLERDWRHLRTLIVDRNVSLVAAMLATHYGLRGFDAVHLASALRFRRALRHPIRIATYDGALSRAARAEGFELANIGG